MEAVSEGEPLAVAQKVPEALWQALALVVRVLQEETEADGEARAEREAVGEGCGERVVEGETLVEGEARAERVGEALPLGEALPPPAPPAPLLALTAGLTVIVLRGGAEAVKVTVGEKVTVREGEI